MSCWVGALSLLIKRSRVKVIGNVRIWVVEVIHDFRKS